MTLLPRTSFLVPALFVLGSHAEAQRLSLVEGQEVLEFARGLASEFSFVDLAAEVLADAEQRGFPSSMQEQVAIEKCSIFGIGALAERDPVKRHKLFDDALQAYTDFIDQNSRSEALPDAEAGFVQTSAQYAQSMLAALENAKGEEAEQLRTRRIEVLTEAVSRTGDLIEGLKNLDEPREADKRRLYDLMLNRGRMLTETARNQEDPSYSFEQANVTLEELSFAAGEGSPYSLRAFDAMGNNLSVQGRSEEAAYMFQYVVDTAIPSDLEYWNQMVDEQELSQADKDTRWLFVELSSRGLVKSWADAGDLESSLTWAMHFYNTRQREGFTLSVPGYLSMLEVGRTLLNAGGYIGGSLTSGNAAWFATVDDMKAAGHNSSRNQRSASELALSIAQTVKEDNRQNSLQVRAQKLIKDIISQPGVKKSPDVLLDAAMGEYNEQNWPAAIDSFKQVLDAISREDAATQSRFGPEVMYYLGRCYRGDGRALEAVLCFQEGITTYKGDEIRNNQNAKGMLSMIKQALASMKSEDAALLALRKEAEEALVKYAVGDDAGSILWQRAEKARRAKKWDEAIGLYKQIPAGSDYYEKSVVNIGVCRLRKGEADPALQIFDDYLGNYVTDPKNAIAQSETRKTRRREAMASAEFYRGYIYFKRAEKKPGSDPNWPIIVEKLATFYTDYPEQAKLAPATMRMVALAHLALDDVPAARTMLDAMLERFPGEQFTGSVAIEVYKKLKADLDAARKAGDEEKVKDLLRQMADLLKAANASSASPSFDNMRNESRHWMELKNWAEAERVLSNLRSKFAEERPEDMAKYVLPDLAEAFLQQTRVNDALEVLIPLNEDGLKPSKAVVLNFCRAITGWVVENDLGKPTVVPGATQDPELLQRACDRLEAITKSAESWTGEWCELRFATVFAYYVYSKVDSAKASRARNLLDSMISIMGGDANFPDVDRVIKEEGGEVAERLGGHVLRKRFVWINGKVPS